MMYLWGCVCIHSLCGPKRGHSEEMTGTGRDSSSQVVPPQFQRNFGLIRRTGGGETNGRVHRRRHEPRPSQIDCVNETPEIICHEGLSIRPVP